MNRSPWSVVIWILAVVAIVLITLLATGNLGAK
jgi:hypothetical protein